MPVIKQKGTNKGNGTCNLAIEGDMTIYVAEGTYKELLSYYPDYKRFNLDMSSVEEIDSTGIQILLSLASSAESEGKAFHLLNPSEPVNEVLGVLQLAERFGLTESE